MVLSDEQLAQAGRDELVEEIRLLRQDIDEMARKVDAADSQARGWMKRARRYRRILEEIQVLIGEAIREDDPRETSSVYATRKP